MGAESRGEFVAWAGCVRPRCVLGIGLFLLGALLPAQAPWECEVPTTGQAPRIDGRIGEEEWRGAGVIENFRQVEPLENAKPSEKTTLRFLVDSEHLYIAIHCWDSEPDQVIRTQMVRDARLDPDDRIELVLDTFHDRRSAFFFQINASGSKGDGLVENNGAYFNKNWDGIWKGQASIDERGWHAELAIPAKTIGMGDAHESFGFNARRFVKRKNEVIEWAYPLRTRPLFQMSSAGVLKGMEVLEQGTGIDFTPFTAVKIQRDHDGDRTRFELEPGFDLRYRVTPELAATVTYNTDFAEVEVDSRVVNLTRFPVFFPEKRDFFLQDAGLFNFAGFSRSLIPFFSRRIGLDANGGVVPILGGAKLTGRVGDLSIGLLDVVTDDSEGTPIRNLAVARLALNVQEESTVGMIATLGDPTSAGNNAVLGFDHIYRTRNFLNGRNLRISSFALGSWDSPEEDPEALGYAYGTRIDYPNDLVNASFAYWEFGEKLRPALGFVRRRGVRRAFADFQYRPRPGGEIRRFEFGIRPDVYWRIDDGEIESFSLRFIPVGLNFDSGELARLSLFARTERLVDPFEINDGVTIDTGEYDFRQLNLLLRSSDKRPFSAELNYTVGSFFDGRRRDLRLSLNWRAAPGVNFTTGYQRNVVKLPAGQFNTNLATFRVGVDFTPKLSWSLYAQYDDISDSLGVNSRIRWIIDPGKELFFVVNQGFSTEGEDERFRMRPLNTDFTIKIAWTFRF